jgi:hypothetical protein
MACRPLAGKEAWSATFGATNTLTRLAGTDYRVACCGHDSRPVFQNLAGHNWDTGESIIFLKIW